MEMFGSSLFLRVILSIEISFSTWTKIPLIHTERISPPFPTNSFRQSLWRKVSQYWLPFLIWKTGGKTALYRSVSPSPSVALLSTYRSPKNLNHRIPTQANSFHLAAQQKAPYRSLRKKKKKSSSLASAALKSFLVRSDTSETLLSLSGLSLYANELWSSGKYWVFALQGLL